MTPKLPPGWEKTKLSTICDLIRGITFPASEKEERESASNICCLRTTNVQNEIVWDNVYFVPKIFVKKDAQVVREGDILMSMANSYELVGKTALVKNLPMNATFGAFLAAIRPKNKVNNRYIFYQLRTEQAQNALRMGSSQTVNIANISHQKLNELEILIAPPDEQKRIVARLDQLLARVDNCRAHLDRAAAAIKRFRQSVLNAAVTGQLFPETLKPATVEIANRFMDYKLPEIPLTWSWTEFSDVATVVTNLKSPDDYPEYPHIAPNHIESYSGRLLPIKTVKEDKVISPNHLFSADSIIYSKIRPYLCKAVVVDFEGLCSADMYPIKTTCMSLAV